MAGYVLGLTPLVRKDVAPKICAEYAASKADPSRRFPHGLSSVGPRAYGAQDDTSQGGADAVSQARGRFFEKQNGHPRGWPLSQVANELFRLVLAPVD